MYIPKSMEMNGRETVSEFISSNNFGVLVTANLEATHLPFVFEPDEGTRGVLYGHVAKANNQWKEITNQRVLIIFSGPHSYVSPTWYYHTPAVPTWNYAAVHCYGTAQLLEGDDMEKVMQDIVIKHEPSLLSKKEVMSDEYQQKLQRAIVVFRIVVDDIQAKEKLGQQRQAEDQQGVYVALKESSLTDAQALADYMEKREIGLGH